MIAKAVPCWFTATEIPAGFRVLLFDDRDLAVRDAFDQSIMSTEFATAEEAMAVYEKALPIREGSPIHSLYTVEEKYLPKPFEWHHDLQ